MASVRQVRAWKRWGAGLAVGLSVGLALAAGVWLGAGKSRSSDAALALEELKLRAFATHGGETMAMATGPIDESIEGLFILDYLTGDLNCYVLNSQGGNGPVLAGLFRTNVTNDLPVDAKSKKPAYLITTGSVNFRGGVGGNARPANSIVYVCDQNTGLFVAYSFPWARAAVTAGGAQAREMTRIYVGKARELEIRE